MQICFHFHCKYRKISISIEIQIFIIYEQILMGYDVLKPAWLHLIVYDVTLSTGDNAGNLATWCQIAMDINVIWRVGCHEAKLIDKIGMGDNTENSWWDAVSRSFVNRFRQGLMFIDTTYAYTWVASPASAAVYTLSRLNDIPVNHDLWF